MGREERTQQIGIRPYQQKDKQAVRGICIATSGLPVKTQRQKELLLLQYCDYYLEQEPDAFLQSGAQADDAEVAEIESLIQQRLDARKAKDWAAADAARDRLNEMGIVLEDGPQGTTWRRK